MLMPPIHVATCDFEFQALIDEDRLLSRLEVLENQLQTYSKVNYSSQ